MIGASCNNINSLFSNICIECFKNVIDAISNNINDIKTGIFNLDNIVSNKIKNKSFVENLLKWEDYVTDLNKVCVVCKSCKLSGEVLLFNDVEFVDFVTASSNYEKEVELDDFDPFEFYHCFGIDTNKIDVCSDINHIVNCNNSLGSSYSNKIYKGFDFGVMSVYLASDKNHDNFKNNLLTVNIIKTDESRTKSEVVSNNDSDIMVYTIPENDNCGNNKSNENVKINLSNLAELRIRQLVLELFLGERLKYEENNLKSYRNFENLCKHRLVLEQLIRFKISTTVTLNAANKTDGHNNSDGDMYESGCDVKCLFSISRDVISFTGYYNKFARCISQTPWILNDRDILSVEELIGGPLLRVTRGKKCKLVGCGREDVDVRNLGNGRKILLEIYKTRLDLFLVIHSLHIITAQSSAYCDASSKRDTCDAISDGTGIARATSDSSSNNKLLKNYFIKAEDTAQHSNCDVIFKCIGITFNSKNVRKQIQNQSELNNKSYNCLIFSEDKLSFYEVKQIENYKFPMMIKQSNPIRISHRRSQDVRNRVVYDLKLSLIHPRVMLMYIETQAGLYIKEFVNGDLGRTSPSLNRMLKTKLHVIKLDVINIKR